MDWATIGTVLGYLAFYAVGRGIGRAQGRDQARREATPSLHVMIELEGNVIGGLAIASVRIADPIIEPPDRPGPPPGHPEA